ncbi:hypothetical protein EPO66_05945 [bacterium]|nr:MAG: hypothetical protein EPO66_05945 [bacterium]
MGNWKENKAVLLGAAAVAVITLVLIVKALMSSNSGKATVSPEIAAQVAAEEAKLQRGGK